jgi:signal transduction histidine kinase
MRLGRRAKPSGDRSELAKRGIEATLFLLLLLLFALLATGVVAVRSLFHSGENRYVKEAIPLRTAVRDVVLQMVNEETAVRGYLITRDRGTLAPYFAGRTSIARDLNTIARVARRHRQLNAQLDQMREEIRSLNGFFAQQITFVADSPEGVLNARKHVLAGTPRFNRFRGTAAEMQATTDAIVRTTEAAQRTTYRTALATLIGAGALALAIAMALLFRVPRRLAALYAAERAARLRAEEGANAARALAHISEAVILLDDSGTIRFWNTAAEHMFGLPALGALGRRIDSLPGAAAVESAARDEGVQVWPIEAGGEERWVSGLLARFAGGRVLTVRDVTDEQLLERTRSEFVATAAHELRTPLSAVYGAATTLRRRADDLDEESRERLLAIIDEESGRLTQIIDQLLVTAQLDRGDLTLVEEECDLPELAAAVVRTVEAHSPPGIELELQAPPRMEPVRLDEARLRQVLVNLVDNAIKYSPEGGRIQIRIADTPEPRVEVSDEGLGIPAGQQERVFEKFFRLDPEMARGVGGSGLGLYISRRIVEQMGGKIRVDSALGQGSTFTVELPSPSVS